MRSSNNQKVQIRLTLSGKKVEEKKRKEKGIQVLGLHMVPNADKKGGEGVQVW